MARIAGVDLPRDKRVEIGLTYIYGIGRTSATRILTEAGVNPDIRCRDLTDDDVKKISAVIDETQTVEGDLRREIALNIKRLQEIGCYRGIRHRKGLPVRGQKTKTNARTRKPEKKMEERHMARIAGVDLPRDKRVEIGLTYIYGIGRTSAERILKDAGVNPDTRVRDLTSEEVKKISAVIDETQVVEGDLRREIQLNIKRLKEIGCYRGIRHRKGLPVRGQKTKTNARTCKGPKRTVANKKK